MSQSQQSLRLLCFGDSLTEGWISYDSKPTPFADFMGKQLREQFPDITFMIDNDGQGGDEICGEFKKRLSDQFQRATREKKTFDWVILLGGTNDLDKQNVNPKKIITTLNSLYEACYKHNKDINVVGVTIPVTGYDHPSGPVEARALVNNFIHGCGNTRQNFHVFDLNAKFPFSENNGLWADEEHPTERGYALWGRMFADFLQPLLRNSLMPAATHGDESLGSKTALAETLSQGWVVVSKRDLDD